MTDKIFPIGIYPATWAEAMAEDAGLPYRPSNGEEGQIFYEAWCSECARDAGADVENCDDNQRCEIIGRTLSCDIKDPNYPTEWQYSKSGQPCCTAWVPAGEPIPPVKDEHTVDMFDGDALDELADPLHQAMIDDSIIASSKEKT